jgi:predicted AlkP superfamily pyrophosphatase or phosphodiesterase
MSDTADSNSRAVPPAARRILIVLAAVFVFAWLYGLVHRLLPSLGGGSTSSVASYSRPPRVQRVLIISIDGCRPDLMLRANTPNLRSLMQRGTYTLWARTTAMSITLPSHTSMVTGVTPDWHRISWNDKPLGTYPEAATIFELAHRIGLSTALVAGKSKFHDLAKPGSVDWVEVYKNVPYPQTVDHLVADSAADMIRRHRPQVMFVHFPDVDSAGHNRGWSSAEQMQALNNADLAVGKVLGALYEIGEADSTFIIVSADHGGQGKSHGPNDARSRHIPWIAVGPGVRRGYDLTIQDKVQVNTEDTFATSCAMMGIPYPRNIDGKFIEQILEPDPDRELLKTVSDQEKNQKKRENVDSAEWRIPDYNYKRATPPEHH